MPRPRPDVQKKVWTNDDLVALGARFSEAAGPKAAAVEKSPPPAAQPTVIPELESSVRPAPIVPQKDPRWYAQQLDSLEGELVAIEGRRQALSQFRATSAGLPTGLVLNAPCEGITTDNLIAQLDARRQELIGEMDTLSDTARANDLAPGILVEGRGRAQVESQLSPARQRAAVLQEHRERSDELAENRGMMTAIQAQFAAQRITLLRPAPGDGGNMMTDLVNTLDSRASSIQNEISAADDDARSMGVQPGELR
ncbi:MAG TPA: hypothetical protein VJO53_14920 [Candidatus Acidoferrales bacterium]|nr:hypothetical protein [Candidatus Acidoferrales bacterium]